MATTTTGPTPTSTKGPTPTFELGKECVSVVPGKNGNVPLGSCNAYYNFNPRFEPAVAVASIFGVLTLAHLVLAVMFKKPYTWVLIMGALWETLGFLIHALGSLDQQNLGYATAHSILYLLAPLWINAFVYMTFARMVWFFLPERKVLAIKGDWMSLFFVLADIATFLVQGVGGVMANPGASVDIINTGLKVYLVGLGLQQGFICLFIVLMVFFHKRRLELDARGEAQTYPDGSPKRSWRALHYTMYAVLALISARIIFRIVEFAGGITPSNPIPFHEEYSYALDAFPMMVCILALALFHPGRVIWGPGSAFPTRKEKKQAKADRKAARKTAKEKLKGAEGPHVNVEIGRVAGGGAAAGSAATGFGNGGSSSSNSSTTVGGGNGSVYEDVPLEHPSPVRDQRRTENDNPWRE